MSARSVLVAVFVFVLAACTGAESSPTASIGTSSGTPSSGTPSSAPSASSESDGKPTATAKPPTSSEPTTSAFAAMHQPTAVAFWDDSVGIVGITVFAPDGSAAAAEILRTSDGGRTWAKEIDTPGRVEQLVVSASRDGWAVVGCPSDGPDDCASLLRSTDGGTTWMSTGTTGMTRVSFTDADRGWGIFPGTDLFTAELRRTSDGGSTWSSAADPCVGSKVGGLGDIAFRSAAIGLAVCAGQPGAGSQLKSVVRTTDGGATWHVRASTGDFTGAPTGRTGSIPVGGYVGLYGNVVVAPDGAAWMTGGRLVAQASSDGGATWLPLGLGDSDVNLVQSAWPLDRAHGFALLWAPDRQATLLESTSDGGKTWTEVTVWPVAG